ncbi:MAG: alpha/beta hydrolase [Rhodococcus sp. (in: high G+C Gram-positive bacteria)]|uniref:alpha/beta hydrolase family protein n=1 Tax=Rhodococcus sp. TaxID=1831 RepID=UPI003BAFB97B
MQVPPVQHRTLRTAFRTECDEYAVTVPASGDPALILIPHATEPSGMVFYLHGRTGDETVIHDRAQVRDALLDAGYIVACPFLHGDRWGNRQAQDDLCALDDWVNGRWPAPRRFVIGESMGGNAAANALRLREIDWDGAVFIAPSLSMQAVWERGGAGRETLSAAYGLAADGHDLESRTDGWDAVRHHPGDYAGVRVLVYASADDEIANIPEVTGPWADRLRRATGTVEFLVVSGEHVSDDHFRPAELVSFFGAR